MDAQTGTEVTCELCSSYSARYKVHVKDVNGPRYDRYMYLCEECLQTARVIHNSPEFTVTPYIGAPPEGDDPWQEVRQVYDELMDKD